MTTDLDKAVEQELADLFERLDDILIEESPMHPFGCATWEEASRIAIDMAKEALSSANARAKAAEEESARLAAILNTPEVDDFARGVVAEAQHQRGRWGVEDDAGKSPLDWFWLIGYLAQKAAFSAIAGDAEKAKHHTISTAAALANWHAFIAGDHTLMRPGIEPPLPTPPEGEG